MTSRRVGKILTGGIAIGATVGSISWFLKDDKKVNKVTNTLINSIDFKSWFIRTVSEVVRSSSGRRQSATQASSTTQKRQFEIVGGRRI